MNPNTAQVMGTPSPPNVQVNRLLASENAPIEPEICIIGAGLAGLALARALIRTGRVTGNRICVVHASPDPETPLTGGSLGLKIARSLASSTPMALLNPATGRSARLCEEAEARMAATTTLLDEMDALGQLAGLPDGELQCKTGVLRPAKDEKMAHAMREGHQKDPWPHEWASWLDPHEVHHLHPRLDGQFGALWIPVARSVRMPALLARLTSWLRSKGVHFQQGEVIVDPHRRELHIASMPPLDDTDGRVTYPGGQTVAADEQSAAASGHMAVASGQTAAADGPAAPHSAGSDTSRPETPSKIPYDILICAAGAGTDGILMESAQTGEYAPDASFEALWKEELGLHKVKGQTLLMESKKSVDLPFSVSKVGYLAPLSMASALDRKERGAEAPDHIVVGSTFEHDFDSLAPDEKGRLRLLDIAESILPGLSHLSHAVKGWAGVRVHHPPDREPVIRRHPSFSTVLAFTGFGSKGLLTIPLEAERLAVELVNERAG